MLSKRFFKTTPVRFRHFSRQAYGAFRSMHKVINIGVLAISTLTFARATPTQVNASAERQTDKDIPNDSIIAAAQELDEVVVTASRTATPFGRATKLVTVITREEIAQAPVQSIHELLVYAANVDAVQRGGQGVQADISIRGGSADQTAVLINGVNLSNPHTGHFSFDLPINLSDIERIEILHGPSALIYGSGAFSGGVNIITRKKTDATFYSQLKAGMYALADAEIRSSLDTKNTTNSLSFGYRRSDGYTEHSEYNIYNALWQTALRMNDRSQIDLMAGYNNKSYGANTFYSALYPNQYERTSGIVGAVSGHFDIDKKLQIIPQIYWSRRVDQFDLIKDSETGRNYHCGDTYGANMMFRVPSRWGVSHFGGEMRRESIVSSKLGQLRSKPQGHYTHYDARTQTNMAVEHTLDWRQWSISAGVLANYNTLQNDRIRFYPSVGISIRPVNNLKLFATWSRSSRLPTFTDLYYTTETHNANETLQAERSESFDIGINYRRRYFDITLVGYLMNGRDMIDWVRRSGDEKWAAWNHTAVDKLGFEAQIRILLSALHPAFGRTSSLTLGYARMNQNCDTQGLESKYTLNYLRDKLTANLQHIIGKSLSVGWYFRFQDRMGSYRLYENGADKGLHPYPAFSTLDLKIVRQYKKASFFVNINNVYNTTYFDIGNVPQAGIWLMGGIEIKL